MLKLTILAMVMAVLVEPLLSEKYCPPGCDVIDVMQKTVNGLQGMRVMMRDVLKPIRKEIWTLRRSNKLTEHQRHKLYRLFQDVRQLDNCTLLQ